jgi:hypothetical protein
MIKTKTDMESTKHDQMPVMAWEDFGMRTIPADQVEDLAGAEIQELKDKILEMKHGKYDNDSNEVLNRVRDLFELGSYSPNNFGMHHRAELAYLRARCPQTT